MGEYVQKHKNSYGYGDAETHPEMEDLKAEDADKQEKQRDEAEELTGHSDELLDEIDAVLEENAAGFVAAFHQQGGE